MLWLDYTNGGGISRSAWTKGSKNSLLDQEIEQRDFTFSMKGHFFLRSKFEVIYGDFIVVKAPKKWFSSLQRKRTQLENKDTTHAASSLCREAIDMIYYKWGIHKLRGQLTGGGKWPLYKMHKPIFCRNVRQRRPRGRG